MISISVTALFISVATASVLDNSIYKAESLLYTAKNDIIDIHYSSINSLDDIVFIVERNTINGDFKGLYALKESKTNNTWISTKILDNGQCITSDETAVYIGASNGIYTYNIKENKAEKYGNITANIKDIQKPTNEDIIYAIADNQLYKITDNCTAMKKIDAVNNVQEIVLDKDNNVYLYEIRNPNAKNFEDKYSKPKVIVKDEIIDITGLPDVYNQIKLVTSFASAEGALIVLNNEIYRIFPNGSSTPTTFTFNEPPTAYFLNPGIIQFYGHDKKLYQFNFLGLLLQGLSSALSDFFNSFFKS